MECPTYFYPVTEKAKEYDLHHLMAFVTSIPHEKADGHGDLGVVVAFSERVFGRQFSSTTEAELKSVESRIGRVDLNRYLRSLNLRAAVARLIEFDENVSVVQNERGEQWFCFPFDSHKGHLSIVFQLFPVDVQQGVRMDIHGCVEGSLERWFIQTGKLSDFAKICIRENQQMPRNGLDPSLNSSCSNTRLADGT